MYLGGGHKELMIALADTDLIAHSMALLYQRSDVSNPILGLSRLWVPSRTTCRLVTVDLENSEKDVP